MRPRTFLGRRMSEQVIDFLGHEMNDGMPYFLNYVAPLYSVF
jgi:hypothetical protein